MGCCAIVVVFVLVNALAYADARAVERRTHLIVDNMLASIALVSRMAWDVAQQRLLIDDHIFASDLHDMAAVQRQIDRLRDDLVATAHAYEPLATLPDERETWERVQLEGIALRDPIDHVLRLSRENKDAEARREMMAISSNFASMNGEAKTLVAINRTAAQRSAGAIRAANVRPCSCSQASR